MGTDVAFGEKNNMITVQTCLLNKEQAWTLRGSPGTELNEKL